MRLTRAGHLETNRWHGRADVQTPSARTPVRRPLAISRVFRFLLSLWAGREPAGTADLVGSGGHAAEPAYRAGLYVTIFG